MEGIRKFKKIMLTGFCAVMMFFMLLPFVSMVNAGTREENTQKIERFLNNDAVKRGMVEKGETYERVMRNVDKMSDAQVEKLAEHANVQVGGELRDSGEGGFWSTYGLLVLIVFVGLPIVSIIILVASGAMV